MSTIVHLASVYVSHRDNSSLAWLFISWKLTSAAISIYSPSPLLSLMVVNRGNKLTIVADESLHGVMESKIVVE